VPKIQDARKGQVRVPKINQAVINEVGTEEGPTVAAKTGRRHHSSRSSLGKKKSLGDEFVYQHTDGRDASDQYSTTTEEIIRYSSTKYNNSADDTGDANDIEPDASHDSADDTGSVADDTGEDANNVEADASDNSADDTGSVADDTGNANNVKADASHNTFEARERDDDIIQLVRSRSCCC
jgi:hypothetical protein